MMFLIVFLLFFISCTNPLPPSPSPPPVEEESEGPSTTLKPSILGPIEAKDGNTVRAQGRMIADWCAQLDEYQLEQNGMDVYKNGEYDIKIYYCAACPEKGREDHKAAINALKQLLMDMIPFLNQFRHNIRLEEHPKRSAGKNVLYVQFVPTSFADD